MRSFSSDREKHRYYNSLSEEQKYEAFCDILFDSEHVVFLGGGRYLEDISRNICSVMSA